MLRYSVLNEQIRQAMEHIIGFYVSVSQNSQALTAELIDHSQYLDGSPIMSTIHKKIVRPDVVSMCRPKPYAGAIMEPQPAPLRLFLWNLKPLVPPDALYPLVIDPPALPSQQRRDPTITVATISTGQPDNVGC